MREEDIYSRKIEVYYRFLEQGKKVRRKATLDNKL